MGVAVARGGRVTILFFIGLALVIGGGLAGGLSISLDMRDDAPPEPRRYVIARVVFFVGLALLLTPLAGERIREAFGR
jgi:uncharacterized membrane protein YtjA (UPF0391 family)